MYEVFNWGYSNDEPPKRFSLSIAGSEINIDGPANPPSSSSSNKAAIAHRPTNITPIATSTTGAGHNYNNNNYNHNSYRKGEGSTSTPVLSSSTLVPVLNSTRSDPVLFIVFAVTLNPRNRNPRPP